MLVSWELLKNFIDIEPLDLTPEALADRLTFSGSEVEGITYTAGKIDPDEYNGFAFGFGLDRMAMLKYGIADLRLLFDGNVSYFMSGFKGAESC